MIIFTRVELGSIRSIVLENNRPECPTFYTIYSLTIQIPIYFFYFRNKINILVVGSTYGSSCIFPTLYYDAYDAAYRLLYYSKIMLT